MDTTRTDSYLSDTTSTDSVRERKDNRASKYLTGDWGGARCELEDAGLSLRLFYNQQYQQNFRGGLETHNGHRLSGSYDFQIALDLEKMGLLEGGSFFIETKGHWSDGINPSKVGALFNVNDDAIGDHPVFINKWWYRQTFAGEKIDLRLGVLETTKDLIDVSPYAYDEDKNFFNALSIHNAAIPHRIGMGASLKIQPVDWWYLQIAAIDAQSRPRRTRFDTGFHGRALFLGFAEVGFTPQWQSAKGPMPGRYRVGGWYDPRPKTVFRNTLDGRRRTRQRGDDVGFYVGFDQLVWKENDDPKDTQGLGIYARYGHAHGDVNRVSDYWSAGMSWQGLFPTRDQDVLGLGVSQAILSSRFRREVHEQADRETVYELYCAIHLSPWLIISPDLQVITNPGGDKDDRDAIVGGIRVRVIF
ncbi:MAG: carbohydrate porin [Candidatus Krumholzibacteria bacterium]